MKIPLICWKCRVRFDPADKVYKVTHISGIKQETEYYHKECLPIGHKGKLATARHFTDVMFRLNDYSVYKTTRKYCDECGCVYSSKSNNQRFCSETCQNLAYKKRDKK